MTCKEFFKSTTFKCIAALLSILLVCGIFLTIMYGLLEVSDEERFARAMKKIYGSEVATEAIDLSTEKTEYDYATIKEAYKVQDDGNYLIKSAGKQGYGGDVTCWVVVDMSEDGKAIDGIMKVTVDSAPGESYLSKIKQSALDELAQKYVDGEEIEAGFKNNTTSTQGDDYIATGASRTMRGISNAVNGAVLFVKSYALGITETNFFESNGFKFLEYIDKSATSYSVNGNEVTYEISTLANSPASAFKIQIKVKDISELSSIKGVITSYVIKTYGSVAGKGLTAEEYNEKVYTDYVGKTAADFMSIIGEDGSDKTNENYPQFDIQTGATRSNYLCLYAGLFATANYEKCLRTPFQGGNS